jgi:hypothetical protein
LESYARAQTSVPDDPSQALTNQPPVTNGSFLGEIKRELGAERSSHYQHTIDVDEQAGRFDYDCSGLIDYALNRVNPAAYQALPESQDRPLAQDIVTRIRQAGPSAAGPWQQVPRVDQLQPGDLVSWLKPQDSDTHNTGHVMVVLAAPRKSPRDGEWLVHIADATTSPHAEDSRPAGTNGLGTGTIGLVTDDAGHPTSYYWRGGVSSHLEQTTIALGRISGGTGTSGTSGRTTPPNKKYETVVQPVNVYAVPDGKGTKLDLNGKNWFLDKGQRFELLEPCRDNWCHLTVPQAPGGKAWVYHGDPTTGPFLTP